MKKIIAVAIFVSICTLCAINPIQAQTPTVVYSDGFTSQSDINTNWCNNPAPGYCLTSSAAVAITCPSGAGFTLTTCASIPISTGDSGEFLLDACFVGNTTGCTYNGFDLSTYPTFYAYWELELTAGANVGASGNNFKLQYAKDVSTGAMTCYYDGIVNAEGPLSADLRVICNFTASPQTATGPYVSVSLTTGIAHKLEIYYNSSAGEYDMRFDGTDLGVIGPSDGMPTGQVINDLEPGLYMNSDAGSSFDVILSNYKVCTGTWCSSAPAPAPNPVFTPSSYSFGSINVGSTASTTIGLQNTGNANLTWMGLAITSDPTDFTLTGTTCASPLAPSATCTISLQFNPMSAGSLNADLTMSGANYGGGTINIPLSGTGVSPAPDPVFTPTSYAFGNVMVGMASQTSISLQNTGSGALTWTGFAITGNPTDFALLSTNCASPLVASASCTATVQFNPMSSGAKTAALTVSGSNYGTGSFGVSLTGTGVAAGPEPSFNPASVAFGNVQVGSSSSDNVTLLDNSGAGGFTWTGFAITGDTTDFTLVTTNCSSPLAGGSSCNATVRFNPMTTGAKSANLAISGNNYDTTLNLPLTGTGTAPAPTFTPSSINFGSTNTGTTLQQTMGVSNPGSDTFTWTGLAITSDTVDFTLVSTTCTSPLAGGGSCSMLLQFNPGTVGTKNGYITFSGTNAGTPTLNLALAGTGMAPVAAFSPASYAFGNVNVSTTASETIALQNTGTGPLTWTGLAITGDTTDFAVASMTCSSPLAASASCNVVVHFTPATAGAKSANLTLSGANISGGTLSAALTGTGVSTNPTLVVTPASYSFGTVAIGSSAAFTFTLQNTGNAALTWGGFAITGDTTDFALLSTTCSSPLAASASCTASVQFAPASTGAKSAALTMSGSNYGTGTTNIALSGTGAASTVPAQPGIQIVMLTTTLNPAGTRETIICDYSDTNPAGTLSHWVIFQNNVLVKQGQCTAQMCSESYSGAENAAQPHCGAVDSVGSSAAQ